MSNELWGILIGVLSILVGVYIGFKQGAFEKTKVFISAGSYLDETLNDFAFQNKKKPLWAVVVGVPQKKFDRVIAYIPLVIDNIGTRPLKGNVLIIRYPKIIDCTGWLESNREIYQKKDDSIHGVKYQWESIGEFAFIQVAVPSLQPEMNLILFIGIGVTPEILTPKSHSSESNSVYDFSCTLVSESLEKRKDFSFKAIVTQANSLVQLIEKTDKTIFALHKKECPNHPYPRAPFNKNLIAVIPPIKFWYKIFYPSCTMKKRWMYRYIQTKNIIAQVSTVNYIETIEEMEMHYAGYNETGLPVVGIKTEHNLDKTSSPKKKSK